MKCAGSHSYANENSAKWTSKERESGSVKNSQSWDKIRLTIFTEETPSVASLQSRGTFDAEHFPFTSLYTSIARCIARYAGPS